MFSIVVVVHIVLCLSLMGLVLVEFKYFINPVLFGGVVCHNCKGESAKRFTLSSTGTLSRGQAQVAAVAPT